MSGVVISARDLTQKFDPYRSSGKTIRATHNTHTTNDDAAAVDEVERGTDTNPEAGNAVSALGALLRQEHRRRACEAPWCFRHPDTDTRKAGDLG